MTIRHAVAFLALFGACQFLPAQAAAAPIDCSRAGVDVEHTICAQADLLAKDEAIAQRLASLQQQCPSQQKLLVQGQKFWLRERWDCRNGEGALEPNGTLGACLAQRMDQRLRELNDVPQGCDLSSLAASYRFVDPGYLRQYSGAYVGRTVSVFGGMELDACRKASASPLTGVIVGTPASVRFPVRFSAMPGIQKDFLCAQHPAAHWKGIVKNDGQGAYLYLSDILGSKLD
jgi:uncharacterized protein